MSRSMELIGIPGRTGGIARLPAYPVRFTGTRTATQTISPDITIAAGGSGIPPIWALLFAANGQLVIYNTADFTHTVTAAQAGTYTLAFGPTALYPHVTLFNMAGDGLTGQIASIGITALTGLQILYLYTNSFTGGIPAALGSMSTLTQIVLNGNSLTGSIPAELGGLTNLTMLHLYNNALDAPAAGALRGPKITDMQLQNMSWSQAETNAAVDDIHAGFPSRTAADNTGSVNLSGTNADPDAAAIAKIGELIDPDAPYPNWLSITY